MASSALIDDLLKQFAENPRRVFARLANEYRKRGELDTAIEICRAHVPLQPTYISGYIVLGQALYETGQLDEAQSTFETALGLDPENLIGLRQLGDIARAKGDLDGARAWYRRLLEVDPQNDEVESVLREIDSPAVNTPAPASAAGAGAGAGAGAAQETVSWNDINPEVAKAADQPQAAVSVPAPSQAAADGSASPETLDFDYDVLSAFGEVEKAPAHEAPAPGAAPELEQPQAVAAEPSAGAVPTAAASPSSAPSGPVVDDSELQDDPLPAAFITETMAELYLQQGHREQALDIYRLLLAQRPSDVSLLDRIARLEQPAPPAPADRTVRAFFGRFAKRRPPGEHVQVEPAQTAADVQPAPAEEPPPLGTGSAAATESVVAESMVAESSAAEPQPAEEPIVLETAEAWLSAETSRPTEVAANEVPAHEDATQPAEAAAAPLVEAAAAPPVEAAAAAPVELAVSAESSAPAAGTPGIEDFAPAVAVPEDRAEAAVVAEPPSGMEPARSAAYAPERALSFDELFAGRAASPADEQAAATLAGAYGPESGVTNGAGHPARAAADALSLDDVFGGGAPEHENAAVSFDEFFSSNEPVSRPNAAPDGGADARPAPPMTARRADDADLELFHQWLEGLKK